MEDQTQSDNSNDSENTKISQQGEEPKSFRNQYIMLGMAVIVGMILMTAILILLLEG